MASAADAALNGNVINQTGAMPFGKALTQKLTLALAIAAVLAVMTGFWLWSQKPEYRVLFSNFSDKDGGAIVAALEQMNVPYQFSAGGNAILVPDANVHQARLKIASLGLPKGGNVGFELLENQKFGVSQFVEQVNFQRALEGELEKSIQAVSAVQNARVHLAIPKSTVFVRDQQKPTASVLVHLHPGRTLDPQQVSAVVHLVASSVPDLPIANVTIVDQNGNLLSDTSKKSNINQLDPTQLKYIDEMQHGIVKRVESIILPIVGAQNVHAEATVDVDFASLEQADEIYKPNQTPETLVIRSQQSNESQSSTGTEASGIPGALSNQPPANATAPITANAVDPDQVTTTVTATPSNTEKNVTTNYEVDKTIRYSQQAMGGVKRITVAVVVNHKRVVDANGVASFVPLSDEEKTQITELAKEAMGFNKDRGDSLSVVNSSFIETPQAVLPEIPAWKNSTNINMAKELLKTLLALAVVFLLYKRLLKPMMTKLVVAQPALLTAQGGAIVNSDATVVHLSQDPSLITARPQQQQYQHSLDTAKMMAKDNPKMVANVVTAWVSGNE